MNILINFSTLKEGGGQNVGLNFLSAFKKNNHTEIRYYFLVVKNSAIHLFLKNDNNSNIIITFKNPYLRIINEFLLGWYILWKYRIDAIYTYFGYGLFPLSTPQIIGVAVSNLFYPEIDFWQEYHGLSKIKLKLIDKYRKFGINRAAGLIFENRMMQNRCVELFRINSKKTKFILPSIDISFSTKELKIPLINNSSIKILLLCGWQKNKNILKIPAIANELKKSNKKFVFVITAPPDNSEDHCIFRKLVNYYCLNDMVILIGPIKKEYLRSLYQQVDIVLLISKLESFSNNIIESWYFEKPLIITDAEWSRSICAQAAHYVEIDSIDSISNGILEIANSVNMINEIIKNGRNQLKVYPTIEEKTNEEIIFIKSIIENH